MSADIALRRSRKLDHIEYALTLDDGPADSRFTDFQLLHNCLPELALNDIRLETAVAGISLPHPLIINAITGGTDDVADVNAKLAEVARLTGSAMAVGSQFAALRDPAAVASYSIIRDVNPSGILFANLGAHASVEQAKAAVDMIDAAALQIHLNPAQELMMPEGDRSFTGYLAKIQDIVHSLDVPVIAKETGCGIAGEQATSLVQSGVRAIDVSGAGGTNFPAIEAARGRHEVSAEALSWGIPAAISAAEVAASLPDGVDMIVSGGVRSPLDAVKSFALGGRAVAVAGPVLRLVQTGGVGAAVSWVESFLAELRCYLLLTGSSCPADLLAKPLVVSGFSRDWLNARGIDTDAFARRGRK
ncbi:type 2 isopentenyl-diphosphate Delta-isomerase [Anaerosporomusa subterranea]|uniref:Isopentenyl-diphosphate delta-isomerase n=1 Tax=Anaerosporomusa subterranea TaxID=1794912 RepID=A0A154BU92_ANASB|nr:type 2 isopentenyl-diphosphate Delta-isomerase [Anaerosporomusa subterranea]KYZ77467.1 type 2 isopentenyl-diphosphate Delta-isomerase [Anaerosporomusa subterranea]